MSNPTKTFKFQISIKTSASSSSSAHLISTDDDLLTEILIRLPVKSLLQFKSVSKHWLSLITSQHVINHPRRRKIISASALFLNHQDFIPLDNETKPPFKKQSLANKFFDAWILQSCNGLLLSSSTIPPSNIIDVIYNPTTNKFTTLPRSTHHPKHSSLQSINLAFDPSKSPHYKVICVYHSNTSPEHHEIEIYSSETGLWRQSGQPFLADIDFISCSGIFWNGAIHWLVIQNSSSSLYFDINEEKLGETPLPLVLVHEYETETMPRFGFESLDHLHLIQLMDQPTTKFDVYEMERDYSGWFLKYKVDLGGILSAFPEMICSYYDPVDMFYYMYSILSVVRQENEEDSFMVLLVPGKIITYKFVDMSFKKLCDFEADPTYGDDYFHHRMAKAFQFIESLAAV